MFLACGEEVDAGVSYVCCIGEGRDCDSIVELLDTMGRHAS